MQIYGFEGNFLKSTNWLKPMFYNDQTSLSQNILKGTQQGFA